jgi:glutamate-1-semialdehyde 2,1-aminomutase
MAGAAVTRMSRSQDIFRQSLKLIPGGVNSPVRAFNSVGGTPFIVDKGAGAWLYGIDGRKYIDYVMSWGPLILGHSFKPIIETVVGAAKDGTSFGAPTKKELELAVLVNERMPWIEKLRLVSSGTEACMTTVRLARGVTDRDTIIKFDGGYHGHSDSFLIKAGSGLATGGLPSSRGVPKSVTENTISLPYNNLDAAKTAFDKYSNQIAAIIVEPIAANMGVVPPQKEFLRGLRKITAENGSLLIFDEVITGFRVGPGGAAQLYGIKPDLVCLGKILGGGMPIGAIGGKADIMDWLAPLGPVYQAGTLSGNPLSTAAGIATLKHLGRPGIYVKLKQYADDLTGAIDQIFKSAKIPLKINKVGSLFTLFFNQQNVTDFESAQKSDMNLYAEFFQKMLEQGIFIPPSGYEAWFVSTAHKKEHLNKTIKAIKAFIHDRN